MVSTFGEIVYESSRAFADDEEEEFTNQSLLRLEAEPTPEGTKFLETGAGSQPPVFCAFVGKVAVGFGDGFIYDKSGFELLAQVFMGGLEEHAVDMYVTQPKKKPIARVYRGGKDKQSPVVFALFNTYGVPRYMANDVLDKIVDYINACSRVFVFHSDTMAYYQSDESCERQVFYAASSRYSRSEIPASARALPPPNVIGGVSAAVLNHCELTDKPGLLLASYGENELVDSISLQPFADLIKKGQKEQSQEGFTLSQVFSQLERSVSLSLKNNVNSEKNATGAIARRMAAINAKYLKLQKEHDELEKIFLPSKTGRALLYQKYLLPVLHNVEGKLVNLKHQMEFPNYFEILPDEVIENVLGRLTDPQDYLNVNNTCQRFRKILEPLKTKRLFAGVVANVMTAFPWKRRMQMTLNARRVCCDWKKATDKVLENRHLLVCDGFSSSYRTAEIASRLSWQFVTDNYYEPEADDFFVVLDSEKKLNKFENAFKNCTANPFVGRAVTLKFSEDSVVTAEENDQDVDWEGLAKSYWIRVVQFLKKFGMHVWHCRLNLEYERIEWSDFWSILRKIWALLPNLRKLTLMGMYDWQFYINDESQKVVEMAMEETLTRDPFPELPQLVSLRLGFMPRLFYRCIFPVLRLRLRHLDFVEGRTFFERNPLNCILPNLEVFECHDVDSPDLNVIHVEWLARLDTPLLKKLNVLRIIISDEDMSRQLLETLKRFSPTLRELALHLGYQRETSEVVSPWLSNQYLCQGANLNFSCLQIVVLANWPHSFDLLLYTPALQSLEIRAYCKKLSHLYGIVQDGETFQIHGFLNRMYESNLWKLKPRLMEVKITHCDPALSYTRQGYEHHAKVMSL